MKNRRHLLAMAFLLAALGLFVTFHFLPGFGSEELGWRAWPSLWEIAQNPKGLDPRSAVLIAAFLNFSLLIVVSPFLRNVFLKSRWAWWGALVFSGLAGAVFWIMFMIGFKESGIDHIGSGGWCLLLAPAFNFIGLLFVH